MSLNKEYNQLHYFLKGYRTKNKMTISDMAIKLGMSTSTLSRIETNKISISNSLINTLVSTFDFSSQELVELYNSVRLSYKQCCIDLTTANRKQLYEYLKTNNIKYLCI